MDDPNPDQHEHPPAIPRSMNPLHHLLPADKLPLPCPVLTRFLGGGVPIGSVTELSGESGSGKTQLSLSLLIHSHPSLSLFVTTEPPFPLRRLLSLRQNYRNAIPLDRLLVRSAHSPPDLLSLLRSLLDHHRTTPLPVRLLVVDSVAALFRSEFDNTPSDLARRSSLFFKISAALRSLARDLRLAVVVTNHVVDVVEGPEQRRGPVVRVGNDRELWSSGRRVAPALGLSWANCVNTRLFLSRTEEGRTMRVVFAPHLPPSSAEFVIRREGVFGVGDY